MEVAVSKAEFAAGKTNKQKGLIRGNVENRYHRKLGLCWTDRVKTP